ncbi:MAG: GGDEF domain-containing protein [Phycisphaerales bacterium]|nr:GGDEF domain-containing protein [Phycisphaerales bacterium]
MSPVSHRRTSRRRLMTVGSPCIEGTDETIGQLTVSSIFAALGELATCSAREPIEGIVLQAQSTHRLPGLLRQVEAIRRLEPALPIIAVAPGLPLPALEGQVDLQTAPPLHMDQIRALLEGEAELELPTAPVPAPDAIGQAPQTVPSTTERTADALGAASGESGRITDTALIEALLQQPDRFRQLLIRSLAERSGQPSVRLESAAGGPDAATVHNDGVTFGHLCGGDTHRLKAWTRWMAVWLRLEQRLERLREEALCDDLTGALNRRGLDRFLEASIEAARSARREVTVMVFDIDDFKAWNDRWGHEAGDTILRQVVQLLGSVIRDGDAVARTGGDEFVVVFADRMPPRTPGSTHPDSIDTIARRFQSQITAMKFPQLGLAAPGGASISGGLATFPWDGADGATLIRIADERALASKRRGKNCLTFGPEVVDVSPDPPTA